MQQTENATNRKNRKARRKGPLRVVQSGSVVVKIYGGTNKVKTRAGAVRKYPVFTINYSEGGQRRVKRFAHEEDARAEAESIAHRLDSGDHHSRQLKNTDVESYIEAMKHLEPLGVPLQAAVSEYVHAVKILDGRSLSEAAKDFVQRNRAKMKSRVVPDVVQELLEECNGKSVRYRQSLRSHLNRFAVKFTTEIAHVTTLQMEQWLGELHRLGSRARNNVRCSLVTLFRFARKRGYLPRGIATEADEIERKQQAASEANIYTPAELKKILDGADVRVLPALAIAAFTGLRSASIMRLRWENVKWDQLVIEIPAAIAKNRKRYLVPLLPCLTSWLAPYRERKGLVVTGVRLEQNVRELFARLAIPRKHNGFRDSFISYRVAETVNLPQVAYEAGNSVEMIRSKYLEARTKSEATQWFSVTPARPKNVVSLNGVA